MGLQQGLQQGLREAQQQTAALAKLNLALLADKRYDEIERASKDPRYREYLFYAYGIEIEE